VGGQAGCSGSALPLRFNSCSNHKHYIATDFTNAGHLPPPSQATTRWTITPSCCVLATPPTSPPYLQRPPFTFINFVCARNAADSSNARQLSPKTPRRQKSLRLSPEPPHLAQAEHAPDGAFRGLGFHQAAALAGRGANGGHPMA